MPFSNFYNNSAIEVLLFKNFVLSQLIIWNVGQGQWVTEVHKNRCLHYDLGGEIDLSAQVLKLCAHKPNYLYLSHWDWDHVSFAAKFAARAHSACLIARPEGPASLHKREMIDRIPLCPQAPADVRILFHSSPRPKLTSNDLCPVLESKAFHALIPGDSPKLQEKIWSPEIPHNIQGLVLGHHGSRTSTTEQLLANLPNLKWAVASARKKKYGHPHKEVMEILRKFHVPLLRTEDWGHLHFILTPGQVDES